MARCAAAGSAPPLPAPHAAAAIHAWREIFLNDAQAAASPSVAASVADGHSFLVIDFLASVDECSVLLAEATAAAERERAARGLDGLVRKPVAGLLGAKGVALCDELLLRQLALLLAGVAPSLTTNLFGDALSTSTCLYNSRLAWSEGEPAVNVYTPGGCFTPHEDEQSLTCAAQLLSPAHRPLTTSFPTSSLCVSD